MALLPQVGLALNVMTEPPQSTSCTQEERFVYHAAAARLCVQLQQPDCVPLQPSQWPSSQGLGPHSCILDSTLAPVVGLCLEAKSALPAPPWRWPAVPDWVRLCLKPACGMGQ